MAEKKTRAKKEKPAVELGSLERYELIKIHRRELKGAAYNPRVLSDDAKKKLAAGLKKHGLVAPPTWNKRTGVLVGGHQRISMLDALYGTDDYEVQVAMIDVDEVAERELNLLLNNAQAQGDWDLAKLETLFKETPTIDFAGTGFDGADIFRLFGASPFEARADAELSEVAERIRKARERQEEVRSKVKERESAHFYLVVIFRDDEARLAFTNAVGWDDNRYQDGRQLEQMCRAWIAQRSGGETEKLADADERTREAWGDDD